MEEKKNTTTNNGAQTTATKAKNKFNTKNYDRLYPFVKAGEKAKIEQAAKAAGQSLNDYVVTAIYQRMEREGYSSQNNYVVEAVKEKYLRDTGEELTWKKE